MLHWLKLSHHHHSLKLRPHEHTSYLPLGFMLLVVGFALSAYTQSAYSASPGPEAGSIGMSGIMPGPAPTVAATIEKPTNGQRFSTTPVTVSGTCPKDTLVEVFKNDIFAGSTPCDNTGRYTFEIDLLVGQNILIARVYDSLNQPGPDSNAVTVFYDALPSQADPLAPLNFGGSQLLLNTDAIYRGIYPEKEMTMPVDILGGTPPYAVNIQWGDTTNKVVPRNDNETFRVGHIYKKPGIYQVTLQGSDAAGRAAFLTVAAIVNGQPPVAAGPTSAATAVKNSLLLLWPLYVGVLAVVVSFWLGEQREKKVLANHGLLLHPQG
jgi:hypothetical protein